MADELVINYSDDILVKVRHNQEVHVELSRQGPQGPQGEKGDTGSVTPEMVAARDTAMTKANEASNSAQSAAASALTANTHRANADTARAAAVTARTGAETARTGSETARDASAASATASGSSKDAAAASASAAATSATGSETARAAAVVARTGAESARTTATTQATNAGNSASAAKTSETAAKTSETNAAASEAEALKQKDGATASATAAAGSAAAAKTSETNAAGSATAAAGSATTANTHRTAAATSATNAANSATAGATSASNAATSATNAKNSETAAAGSATSAATSAGEASSHRAVSLAIQTDLRKAYLGAASADPTRNLNGDPLTGGEVYVSSTTGRLRFYNGSVWADAGVNDADIHSIVDAAVTSVISGAPGALDTLKELADAIGNDPDFAATMTNSIAARLEKAQNLADLPDKAAARTNLGSNSATNLTAGTLPAARFTDVSHGARGGGTLHANATRTVDGFMSAADKVRLDDLPLGDLTQAVIAGAATKDTPVDGDTLAILDSAASNAVKRLTWARTKLVLKAYFDTLYATASHVHANATATVAGFMSGADKSKLDGVQARATANSTDADLRDRSTHTGASAISTVTGLQGTLDGKAPLASPTFTGQPRVGNTPAAGSSDSLIPNTNFVSIAIANALTAVRGGVVAAYDTLKKVSDRVEAHISSTGNVHGLTAAQLNLGNVDNKSEAQMAAGGAIFDRIEKRAQEWATDRANQRLPLAGGTLTGGLGVGHGQTSSMITMHDSDHGQRFLHCNSGLIGFLGNHGDWTLRVDDAGAVVTRQFGDLNTRIENRAAAHANDRAAAYAVERVSRHNDSIPGFISTSQFLRGINGNGIYNLCSIQSENPGGSPVYGFHAHGRYSAVLRALDGCLDATDGEQRAWWAYRAAGFHTVSDYRQKTDIAPVDLSEAATLLSSLRPVWFEYRQDLDTTLMPRVDRSPYRASDSLGGNTLGFLAHEVQLIMPSVVTGNRDEIDENGQPIYQAVDHSKLVPLLTAALQSALSDIATLKADMAALQRNHK